MELGTMNADILDDEFEYIKYNDHEELNNALKPQLSEGKDFIYISEEMQ